MREREECDFGLQWFALNMAGTLLQSSPRGGNHGHHLAIDRTQDEDCWTIQSAWSWFLSEFSLLVKKGMCRADRLETSSSATPTSTPWMHNARGRKRWPSKMTA